jgi:ribonucleoside-diphosphate reductase alpha chain
MITHIKKRNGTIEEFSPTKVNGWGIWASKNLGSAVEWGSVVIDAVNKCPAICTSEQLQKALIETCLNRKTWEHNRMAGRLYASLIEREIYGSVVPSIKEVHRNLIVAGIMTELDYTDIEYAEIESIIDHSINFTYPHYQLNQIRFKYALRNKVTKTEYESAQFVYMRMAMSLAEKEPKETRLHHVKKYYEHFAYGRINVPTPYYVNLGTKLRGYASCCLYTTDDTAKSLAAGDHIAYMMTCASAGIGTHIKTRSINDPVRGGVIQHQGKLPYYRSMVGAIGANLQNGRGGASTVHYTAFDPEVEVIQKLRHPTTPTAKRIAGCHYSFGSNRTFGRLVAKNEEYAPFSYAEQPELYEAQYLKDGTVFEQLYTEYAKTAKVKLNARDVAMGAIEQAYDTGVQYLHFTDAMNRHTPFKGKIYSTNLCQEVFLVTKPFSSVEELYKSIYEEGDGEIGLCSLAGVVVANITSDEQYAEVAYYCLKMIEFALDNAEYPFPNLKNTAQARRSAAVGIMGLAHWMAKNGQKYDTLEGRNAIHELFETHYYHLVRASLKLAQELGTAKWMHKTLWPKGWLPIDTYERNVDQLVTVGNKREWEPLRKEIIQTGGIRHSVLAAQMPGESSSQGSGTTNGIYPIRDLYIMKTNDTQVNHWAAPDGTKLKNKYQSAWDIETGNMIKAYAVMQKWTDQGISADLYVKLKGDVKVSSSEILQNYMDMLKFSLKSRYYVNSNTSSGVAVFKVDDDETEDIDNEQEYCESCTL